MKQLSRDQRRRRIQRYRKELIEVSSAPAVASGMATAKQELDRIVRNNANSKQDIASAMVECFRWSDHLLARGLFEVLEGSGIGGWQDVLGAAGYRLAEFAQRYRLAKMQGARAPQGHVHTYIPFCNAFLAVCCLGDEPLQREFAEVVLKLGRDGVRSIGAEEDSFPNYVEAVATEILQPSSGRKRMSAIDHPFARVAGGCSEGEEFWNDVKEALDMHLLLCDEGPAAGALRHMNYPAVGLALFPAPVLVAMKLAGVTSLGDSSSIHESLEFPTAAPPSAMPLSLDSDPTLSFLLRDGLH
jgi:hypothetical protein